MPPHSPHMPPHLPLTPRSLPTHSRLLTHAPALKTPHPSTLTASTCICAHLHPSHTCPVWNALHTGLVLEDTGQLPTDGTPNRSAYFCASNVWPMGFRVSHVTPAAEDEDKDGGIFVSTISRGEAGPVFSVWLAPPGRLLASSNWSDLDVFSVWLASCKLLASSSWRWATVQNGGRLLG